LFLKKKEDDAPKFQYDDSEETMLDRIPEIKTDVSELTDDNILATIERRNKKMEEQITSLETKYKETRQTNSDLEDKLKHSDAEYAEKKLKAENARGLLEDLRNELNREKIYER